MVTSPAQVEELLVTVTRIRSDLAAFFGRLYYAALRPEEAVARRRADYHCRSSRVPLRTSVISCRPGSAPPRVADSNSDARAPVDT